MINYGLENENVKKGLKNFREQQVISDAYKSWSWNLTHIMRIMIVLFHTSCHTLHNYLVAQA